MTVARLADRALGVPLAIAPDKLEVILSAVILPKLRGEPVPVGTSAPRPKLGRRAAIAVLPVHGTLISCGGQLEAQSGLQSYDQMRGMLRSALADKAVDGILIELDSAGGEAARVEELVRCRQKIPPAGCHQRRRSRREALAVRCTQG